MAGNVDTIIVGAGPAGCVLASRLTEDPDRRVLLLEAGPDYGDDAAAWPPVMLDASQPVFDSHGWGYTNSDPAVELTRGRIVSGTSALNACLWIRGSAVDYDGWAALGNPGWGFDDMLPWFRRAERDPLAGDLHGVDGPVPVHRTRPEDYTEIDRAYLRSAENLGLPIVDDLSATPWQEPGVGPATSNTVNGMRMNAAFTYLRLGRSRPNLTVRSDSLVDRVLFDGHRTTGVRLASGEEFSAGDVVLSSGSYGSPSVLLRSGVGPAGQLAALGIPVVADHPGVGENLHDHPLVNGLLECTIYAGYEGKGPTFTPVLIKTRSSLIDTEIDLHIYQGQGFDAKTGRWTFWLSVSLQYARSRGRLWLTSRDPETLAAIDHAWLSDPSDLEALCDGVEFVNRLARTEPLSEVIEPHPDRSLVWSSRDDLRQKIRAQVGTTYHPSGTCKMGSADDPMAVVDQEGRVYGFEGLRVVDASIFPTGPHGNLQFPIVASAEKIAGAMRG